MMDTILNLGLNDKTVAALTAKTGNARFVYDSYRRFVQMYGDVVLGLKPVHKDEIDPFEVIIEKKKRERGIKSDTELTAADLKDLVAPVQDGHQGEDRPRFPRGPAAAALGGDRGRLRLLEQRPGHRLPEALRHPRGLGHGRQRPDDGLRQHGQRLRDGRRLHPRRGDRREHLLRRVPDERPGRGRRRRHADAAPDQRLKKDDAEGLRPAREDPPDPRESTTRT